MQTIHGENNWLLTLRRNSDSIEILRCVTCDERAVLPGELYGLPVRILADHAMMPDAVPVDGEMLRIVCGRSENIPWDNRNLRELTFPPQLQEIHAYALYNCRNLQTLRLTDGIAFNGNGILMNCNELNTIEITRQNGEDQGAMAYFAGELNRELDITVRQDGKIFLRLIFPEYREIYEENSPAHHFDYTIDGAGYPYHHSFRQRQLNLWNYDDLWGKNREMMPETALCLAWWRVRYPYGLTDSAKTQYVSYLRAHTVEASVWLIDRKDTDGLLWLFRHTEPEQTVLTNAAALARRNGLTEALALILEEKHRRFPAKPTDNRFAL